MSITNLHLAADEIMQHTIPCAAPLGLDPNAGLVK